MKLGLGGGALALASMVLVAGLGACAGDHRSAEVEQAQAVTAQAWKRVGNMLFARDKPSATLLKDGRVLVVSGKTSEIFSPATGQWHSGSAPPVHGGMSVTTLPDGKVVGIGSEPAAHATYIYDSEIDAWLAGPSTGASYGEAHTVTVTSQIVLALGGNEISCNEYTCEISCDETAAGNVFDLDFNLRARTSSGQPHGGHTATALRDGRILVVGGKCAPSSAEIHGTPPWTPTASTSGAYARGHTATLLNDGRVLVLGGETLDGTFNPAGEIYDPVGARWRRIARMSSARSYHTATLLNDGRVLVVGGTIGYSRSTGSEIYDPATDRWSPGPVPEELRKQHAAVVLRNGSVLVIGGLSEDGYPLETAELLGGLQATSTAPAPPPEVHFDYLSRTGVGSVDSALAYYNTIAPDLIPVVPASAPPLDTSAIAPGRRFTRDASPTSLATTLDLWTRRFMGDIDDPAKVKRAFYQNAVDLGFWREMVCTNVVARGQGGCRVRNWRDPADVSDPKKNLGTVAMAISLEGYTQFFVFGPDGFLSPVAKLDSEGFKAVPQVCTPCHAGRYLGPKSDGLMASIFREFDPGMLHTSEASGRDPERDWFALNHVIAGANDNLVGEREGGLLGVDHAKQAVNDYVRALYPAGAPPALRYDSPQLVPPSYDTPARTTFYTKVVAKYCMPCHRSNALDFAQHDIMGFLGPTGRNRVPLFSRLIDHEAGSDLPVMPHSELGYTLLKDDWLARAAAGGWLASEFRTLANP